MSERYMKAAAKDGRLAVLPVYLQVGRTVWYWRECLCDDDGCPDGAGSCCPLNHDLPWNDPAVLECERQHPVLDQMQVHSVWASFTPRGIEWTVNGLTVAECWLRQAFFPSEAAARRARPERISYG